MSAAPFKKCGCGRAYDPAQWAALPLVGHQQNDGEAAALELRNCACNSTICIEVPVRMSGDDTGPSVTGDLGLADAIWRAGR